MVLAYQRAIMRTRLTSIIVTTLLVVIPHTAQALTLTFSQNPDPFQAFEDTAGNIGFLNVMNTDPETSNTITSITFSSLFQIGGEFDDQATNIVLIGPNPTPANPLQLGPGSNFNIKFSWDAVDKIKDNDVDFGLWEVLFELTGVSGETKFVAAHLRVNDLPLPAALPLFATGLGALGLLGWWRRRKAAA
jgi:hypothetical protein